MSLSTSQAVDNLVDEIKITNEKLDKIQEALILIATVLSRGQESR